MPENSNPAKVVGGWKISVGKEVIEESLQGILEGVEIMRLQKLIGDGKASVSTGYNIGHSEDYGNLKAEAFVSVNLTCNQSIDVIEKAKDEASSLALTFIKENFETAMQTASDLVNSAAGRGV